MLVLTATLVVLAMAGFLHMRARGRMRWRKMIDAYADREIAQLRRSI